MKKFTIPICAVAFLGLTAFFASACSNGNAKDFVKDFSETVYNAGSKDASMSPNTRNLAGSPN